MVLLRKTVNDFGRSIGAGVASRDTEVDTEIGPVKDIFITPVAEVMKSINDDTVYLSQLQSLKYAVRFNPSDLDDFVYNEGLVRWSASPSVTIVTFSRLQPPAADILVPVNFPIDTLPNPSTGNQVQFRTIESKIMYGPLTTPASAYRNADTGRYEISVAAYSIGTGANTSVGANTIKAFGRPFPSFEYVTNKAAATSGLSLESNEDLAERCRLQVRGNQEATPTGLKLFCLDNFGYVTDAYVAYGSNEDLTRDTEDAGAVDVWVKGSTPLTHQAEVLFPGIGEVIPVPKQPMISVISVTYGSTTFTKGVDYEVVTGEGVYAYSIQAMSGVRFSSSGTSPPVGAAIIINYEYNALITLITTMYRQPEYYVIGNDALFRWAQPLFIEVEGMLKVRSGNPDDVLALVKSKILTYINSLKLGVNVEEFDIDSEVAKIYGVDNWVYSKLAIKGSTGVGDISVSASNYAYINPSDLIISLTS